MRSTLWTALTLSLTAITAQAQDDCCCYYRQPCPQLWTVSADAVALERSSPRHQVLLQNGTTVLADAHDLQPGFEVGPRMTLVRRTRYGWDMEFSFFQLDGWEASLQDAGGAGRSAVFGTATYPIASTDPFQGLYTSEFMNAEANVRIPIYEENVFQELSFLVGFRYANLKERFQANLLSSPATSVWETDAENRMYGLQIGADGLLTYQIGPMRIGGLAKAGVFYNRSKVANSSSLAGGSETLANEDPAFLGEVGLSLLLPVTKHLTVRGGYECMWLQTVALAPEQIPNSSLVGGNGQVNTHGDVFAHGAFVGLDLSF